MVLILLWLCCAFFGPGEPGDFHRDDWAFVSGSQAQTHKASLVMTFLRKSGPLVSVWIKSLATTAWHSFFSGGRSHGMNFATTHFMSRSSVNISDTVVLGIPRSSDSARIPSSHTVSRWSLLIAGCTTCSGVLLVAGLPECGSSLSTDSQPPLQHLCHTFICTTLIASSLKTFWIIWIVSMEECSSLTQDLMWILCSTCSVILNATATCPLNGVSRHHWLVQWSRHCSRMCIPVHSPWLPGYIHVTQTILIVLMRAGLYLDRHHTPTRMPKVETNGIPNRNTIKSMNYIFIWDCS